MVLGLKIRMPTVRATLVLISLNASKSRCKPECMKNALQRVLYSPKMISLAQSSCARMPAHQGQKLLVARRSANRRLDRTRHLEPQFCREPQHFIDCPAALRVVAYYSALADLPFADFELRLDECDDLDRRGAQLECRGQHKTQRDETH